VNRREGQIAPAVPRDLVGDAHTVGIVPRSHHGQQYELIQVSQHVASIS
jgi:hypothetical protein